MSQPEKEIEKEIKEEIIPFKESYGVPPSVPIIFAQPYCCCDYDRVYEIQPILVTYLREHVTWFRIRMREIRLPDFPFEIATFSYRIKERPTVHYRLAFNIKDLTLRDKWHDDFEDLRGTLKARYLLEDGKIRRTRLQAPPIWSIDYDISKLNPDALVFDDENKCIAPPDQEMLGKDLSSILNGMSVARGVAFCLSFCWSSDIDSGK
jgi:hypothetical protein